MSEYNQVTVHTKLERIVACAIWLHQGRVEAVHGMGTDQIII